MQNKEIVKAAEHLSKHDKVLSTIIKNNGIINLTRHKQYFNLLLRSIIGQQLSMYAAAAIEKRFMDYFGNSPKPESVLAAEDQTLRLLGLSNAKIKYVKDLSQKVISGEVVLNGISKKTDDEIIAELTKVKGIGVWTVHMFLIFTLGRPDILPFSDLGVRKAIMTNYGLKKMPEEKKVLEIARKNNWHPYCSTASLYLWKSLEF